MIRFAAALLTLCWAPVAVADVEPIGPFTGDRSENFSSFGGGGGGHTTLDIFDGDVTLTNLTPGGAIKIEFMSTLIVSGKSDTVVPRSAPVMMGQLGIMQWEFHTPISQFGGYFENNSFADHVTFDFFDAQGNLIDSVVGTTLAASNTWTWNGWNSDDPIHRAVSTGNNALLLNGFIWYDDLEITYALIPEPGSATACAAFAMVICLGRRCCRRWSGVRNSS